VVTRRVVVRRMMQRRSSAPLREVAARAGAATDRGGRMAAEDVADGHVLPEKRISDREEVDHLLEGLGEGESQIVRMYHLEGKSYHEISEAVGVSENSIGPILSRARSKMRRRVDQTTG
jgi:RNA polymerase sigma-70 factor (ECF subfamily)